MALNLIMALLLACIYSKMESGYTQAICHILSYMGLQSPKLSKSN